MIGIVEFLVARLDEDEAAAVRAARPEPWVKLQPPRPDWYVQFWADQPDRAAVIADPESSAYPIVATLGYDCDDEADEDLAEGRVEHIARHDPARVLAGVKAKRRVMARHCVTPARRDYPDLNACEGCGSAGYGYGYRTPDINKCPELRDLASAFDQHPDYSPAWRVA